MNKQEERKIQTLEIQRLSSQIREACICENLMKVVNTQHKTRRYNMKEEDIQQQTENTQNKIEDEQTSLLALYKTILGFSNKT